MHGISSGQCFYWDWRKNKWRCFVFNVSESIHCIYVVLFRTFLKWTFDYYIDISMVIDLRKVNKILLKTRSFWILFNLMLREFNWNGHFDHWDSHILTKSWWSLFVEKKSPMTPQITSEHSIQMSMKYDTNYCQRNNKFIVETHCEGVMEQIWLFLDTAPSFI